MLFVVMLGGKHPRAKIEVHDVVFAAAHTLEATYPQLRDGWFGSAKGLHVDAWMAVDGVDGWKVEFSTLPPKPAPITCTSSTWAAMRPTALAKLTTTCW